jgi:hypothetical protein
MRAGRQFSLLLLLAGLMLAGCSQSSTHGTVDGTVVLDGEPLREGAVRFVPVDGASQTASAMVRNGQFTATVPIGHMRVEFSGAKVVGQQKMYGTPDSPKVDMVAELLPPRYNVQSELTLDVQAGSQEAKFELSLRKGPTQK